MEPTSNTELMARAGTALHRALVQFMAGADVNGYDPLQACFAWVAACNLESISQTAKILAMTTSSSPDEAMERLGITPDQADRAEKDYKEAKWLWKSGEQRPAPTDSSSS